MDWCSEEGTACSISIFSILTIYGLYSLTSKNCATSSRQGVIRLQFRSLSAQLDDACNSDESVCMRSSGNENSLESTITRLLTLIKRWKMLVLLGRSLTHHK